ncbi:MAG: PD-(D/E)XK nuclease family protein, partial [Candidatus Eisenbacteria bacterium]|nr:PD-(D/E)XK nuclease family protein [Candidatus Eisenbacteria bacterium]
MSTKTSALKNTFSWSHSRKRLFDDCPRAYYFRYYGSWEGWLHDAPPLARALYILKQLKSRQM